MSDFRRHVLAELLCRRGVLDLLDTYDGPATPMRVREAAEVAGIEGLDELDLDVLATEIAHLQESGEILARSIDVDGQATRSVGGVDRPDHQ